MMVFGRTWQPVQAPFNDLGMIFIFRLCNASSSWFGQGWQNYFLSAIKVFKTKTRHRFQHGRPETRHCQVTKTEDDACNDFSFARNPTAAILFLPCWLQFEENHCATTLLELIGATRESNHKAGAVFSDGTRQCDFTSPTQLLFFFLFSFIFLDIINEGLFESCLFIILFLLVP